MALQSNQQRITTPQKNRATNNNDEDANGFHALHAIVRVAAWHFEIKAKKKKTFMHPL